MKLRYGKDFEQLLKKNLEDNRGKSFEERGFPSITLEFKGGTKITNFLPKFENTDTIKIDNVEYLVKTGPQIEVYDIENKLIDKKGMKITFNKGEYRMMKGVRFYSASKHKAPEDIVTIMLIDGPLEAEFVAVRPEELSENWIYRGVIGKKYFIIPQKDLAKVSLQERIGMNVFQTRKGFYLNHGKEKLLSLYPTVSF